MNDLSNKVVISRSGGDQGRRACDAVDTDAAMSLCALGRLTCKELPLKGKVVRPMNIQSSSPNNNMAMGIETAITASIAQSSITRGIVQVNKARGAAAGITRKYTMKPKDPKRDTSVSFEEMKRLMRVYGPTKALRNRASKENGTPAKPDSIRRKFYRWFPDFSERFVKTADGWYTPKAGHQQEMDYREAMRRMDQEMLVKKRNDKRYNYVMLRNKGIVQVA